MVDCNVQNLSMIKYSAFLPVLAFLLLTETNFFIKLFHELN